MRPSHSTLRLPMPRHGPPLVPPPSRPQRSPPVSCSWPGQAVPWPHPRRDCCQQNSCRSAPVAPSLSGTDTPGPTSGRPLTTAVRNVSRGLGWPGPDCWQDLRTPRGSELELTVQLGAAEMPLKRERREMPRRELMPGPGGQESREGGRGNKVHGHSDERCC